NEHANVTAAFEIQNDSRILDRFPGGFEEQAVLWVYVGRLARGDSEKLCVELINFLEEPTSLGDRFARQTRFRIEKPLNIPPILGHIADCLAALREKFPKTPDVIHFARKTASDSDNCDRVLRHTKEGLAAEAHPLAKNGFWQVNSRFRTQAPCRFFS